MLDFFETENEFCMVTEYGHGELFQVLEDDRFLPEPVIRKIAIQLLQALKVLHTHKIIHRDMKPQNILIGAHDQIKLCDFGFARALQHDHSVLHSIKGTPLYMAPELVQEKPYNYTVDLWSLGVILFELATGKPPFYTDRIVPLIQMIIREPVRYPKSMSKDLMSFLKGLLNKEPRKRLTWPHIQEHPFVRENAQEMVTREMEQETTRVLPRFFADETLHGSPAKTARNMSVERLKNHYKRSASTEKSTHTLESDPQEQSYTLCADQRYRGSQKVKSTSSGKNVIDQQEESNTDGTKSTDTDVACRMEVLWEECKEKLKAGSNFSDGESTKDTFTSNRIASLIHLCTSVTETSLTRESPRAQQIMQEFTHQLYQLFISYHQSFQANRNLVLLSMKDLKCLHYSLIDWTLIMTRQVRVNRQESSERTVLWHRLLRCCIVISNLLQSYFKKQENDQQTCIMYREFCQKNIALVKNVLRVDPSDAIAIHGKMFKWLGALIDQSRNVVILLKEAYESGIIELLCTLLPRLKELLQNGANIKYENNIHFLLLLLSEFICPNGQDCLSSLPIPVMHASTSTATDMRRLLIATSGKIVEEEAVNPHDFQDVCARIRSCVSQAIDAGGLTVMTSMLNNTWKKRDSKPRRNSTPESWQGSDPERQAENENSVTCCILKILLYAMDSSDGRNAAVHLPEKSRLDTAQDIWKYNASNVSLLLLEAIEKDALRPRELLMTITLLSVLIRNKHIKGMEAYTCVATMYRELIRARQNTLLSYLCAFFVSIDEYSLREMESIGDVNVDDHEQLTQFLHRGMINKQCMSSILYLIFQKAECYPIQDDHGMLASFRIRARGFLDAGIMILMRCATKIIPDHQKWTFESDCGKKALKSIELQKRHSFVSQFITRKGIWRSFKHLLDTEGSSELSPHGLICLLQFLRTLRQALLETQHSDLTALNAAEENFHESMLPPIIKILRIDRIHWLLHHSECIGGGIDAVRTLIHAIIEVLGIPFMISNTAESSNNLSTNSSGHLPTSTSIIRTQEVLHECDAVGALVKAVQLYVSTAHPKEDTFAALITPMSFFSRLITSSHHFAAQFTGSNGLLLMKSVSFGSNRRKKTSRDYAPLETFTSASPPTNLIVSALSIINHLARTSAEYYPHLMEFGVIESLHHLLKHSSEAIIRAKALNTVGNLCRHSNLFYPMLISTRSPALSNNDDHSLADFMVRALDDNDKSVRRFACFAIGNASFHDASLYQYLRLAIPGLLTNADQADAKTRSNAGGALGNLVRNSEILCMELCNAKIPQHLWRMAQQEKDTNTRQTLLFSVGNFCVFPVCVNSIVEAHPDFVEELMELHASSQLQDDRTSQSNINRILGKLEALYQQQVSD